MAKVLTALLLRDLAIRRQLQGLRTQGHFLTQRVHALRQAKAEGRNIILPPTPPTTNQQFIAE